MPKRILSALLLLALSSPAFALVGDAPPQCFTVAKDLASLKGTPITPTVYRGSDVRLLLKAMTDLSGPSPMDLSSTTAIMTLVGVPGATPPVVIRFYDAMDCAYFAAATDKAGLAALLARLGVAA